MGCSGTSRASPRIDDEDEIDGTDPPATRAWCRRMAELAGLALPAHGGAKASSDARQCLFRSNSAVASARLRSFTTVCVINTQNRLPRPLPPPPLLSTNLCSKSPSSPTPNLFLCVSLRLSLSLIHLDTKPLCVAVSVHTTTTSPRLFVKSFTLVLILFLGVCVCVPVCGCVGARGGCL